MNFKDLSKMKDAIDDVTFVASIRATFHVTFDPESGLAEGHGIHSTTWAATEEFTDELY